MVILTEWDTLWTGRVEDFTDVEAPGLPLSVALSCVDDLNRGATETVSVLIWGYMLTTYPSRRPPSEHADGPV